MKFSLTAVAALAALATAAPTGEWEDWEDQAGQDTQECNDKPDNGGTNWPNVFNFTSTYNILATPDQVIGSKTSRPRRGQPGAYGYFNFGINSYLDTICYNITLVNVKGILRSPASTATHIHKAKADENGPPKITFPNPIGDDSTRRGAGCMKGPFLTGVFENGIDTGSGFKVAEIEANPSFFFTDVHTAVYTSGAVRGQIAWR